MSGGISAIKGFDYQATVILDILFDHFDRHDQAASVRPEGIDDLDLSWAADAVVHRQYVQIKKPTEDVNGNLNPSPWTLTNAINELFPNTILHLTGNNHRQVWILGDEIDSAINTLIRAGENAPTASTLSYWTVVHRLARNKAFEEVKEASGIKDELYRWRVPSDLQADPVVARARLLAEFSSFAKGHGSKDEFTIQYAAKVSELHACLPSVLARTEIRARYGTELEVAERVYSLLEQRYGIKRVVIEKTLFRNLRGFINDVSKQVGRSFNKEELELELRSVWPTMIPIKEIPPLEPDHVPRRDLALSIIDKWNGRAVEIVGISGSGKTTIASEVAELYQLTNPDHLVYYAEIRPDSSLKDVLVGVAFHVRRCGIHEPFTIASDGSLTEEEFIRRMARSYSASPQEIRLLLDLVEGTCSDSFARDLSTFIRQLSSGACRVAVLGQESSLRSMSALERDEYKVFHVDVRGFKFEEFVELAKRHHQDIDRAIIWEVFNRVSAGRSAGLFAKLAQSLARASSLQEMLDMTVRQPGDILAHAEQKRFARISNLSRSAAERLTCFALPFRRRDAEEIFPNENVGAAIRELQEQGLLRLHDKESYEMHETVRAGLEDLIALGVRQEAHRALAAWYGANGAVTAEILHLEKGGEMESAKARAREVFLNGDHWAALYPYVSKKKLVTTDEVIGIFVRDQAIEDSYLLAEILRGFGHPIDLDVVDGLIENIRNQKERYASDYRWASAITDAVVEFGPVRLHDLVVLAVENTADLRQVESVLGCILIAMRRKSARIDRRVISLFERQRPEVKSLMLGILLCDGGREALGAAFRFIASYQEQKMPRNGMSGLRSSSIKVEDANGVVEFLAALPRVKLAEMLVAKSALLGALSGIVWAERANLKKYCIEIVGAGVSEEVVIENAIRVLIFLAEPSVVALCEPLLKRSDSIKGFAALAPALLPAYCNFLKYESVLLDCEAATDDRIAALSILAWAGADLSNLYARLKALKNDQLKIDAWNFFFLMSSINNPFPEAIPLLEEFMNGANDSAISLAVPKLVKLSELPVPEATAMLIRALIHEDSRIRMSAAMGLSHRRSRAALTVLIDQYSKESKEDIAVMLAIAILASGPESAIDLRGRVNSHAISLWQCILSMRTRDESMASWIIDVAVDSKNHWQLRRAAIFAAGRLPYEAAMDRIVSVVMAEQSPLACDKSINLGCHNLLSSILLEQAPYLLQKFVFGKAEFIKSLAEPLEAMWKDWLDNRGLPSGAEAAGWLYDRLEYLGWPQNRKAPDQIIGELHVPLLKSAVIRALRLCGRPEQIEAYIAAADNAWIALKCLRERSLVGVRDPDAASRMRALVAASPLKDNVLLHRVIEERFEKETASTLAKAADVTGDAGRSGGTSITYDEAVRALSGMTSSITVKCAPFVLSDITAEQCEHLIRLADPVNDLDRGVETYRPLVSFTSAGHVVAQRQVTYSGSSESIGSLIRPAVVVANTFGLDVPWLPDQMTRFSSASFVSSLFSSLGAVDNAARFYEIFSQYEDILIPYLCDWGKGGSVRKYVDERIVPTLRRYMASGTDELFDGMCTLTLQVNSPEIDVVLYGLLHRWAQRFDMRSVAFQHEENHHLWRGFNRLTEHPRFFLIEGWSSLLSKVLQVPLRWYSAQSVVRMLEHDPRCYTKIESRLFKEEDWEHFYVDEIDRLDSAAEKMFSQILEP